MYTLIIIDDEKNIINSIRSAIPFQNLDLDIVDVAFNGLDGYNKICEYQPDIIVCDISMPGMTGFEMLEKLSKIDNYTPQVILLTGHNEFEYARKAISYKVSDYLVKPVTPDELVHSIEKAKKSCDAIKQTLENKKDYTESKKNSFIEKLLFDNAYSPAELEAHEQELKMSLHASYYTLVKVFIKPCPDTENNKNSEAMTLFKEKILEYFELCFSHVYHTNFNTGSAYILVLSDSEINIENKCRQILAMDMTAVHIMISNTIGDISELPLLLQQIKYCSTFSYCFSKSKILCYKVIDTYIKENFLSGKFQKYEEFLFDTISNDFGKLSLLVNELNNITDTFEYYDPSYIKSIVYQILFGIINKLLRIKNENEDKDSSPLWIEVFHTETIEELIKICNNITISFKPVVSITASMRQKKLSEQVKKYIYSNYMKPISTGSLANMMYISDRTLRNIFFKQNGISLSDFLRQYRMNKAYELIKSGNYKIYEVTQMVGYNDMTTFRKAFTQQFGKSPSELLPKE